MQDDSGAHRRAVDHRMRVGGTHFNASREHAPPSNGNVTSFLAEQIRIHSSRVVAYRNRLLVSLNDNIATPVAVVPDQNRITIASDDYTPAQL